ncbi:SLD5-like protein [Saccharomyces kudriavzevii IFO 1802]|uniref:SLD5-like protein n=1 Tax=Saccharomyces kudriavzevii (strain ATCC MYA-4449 / AS 2.2408 / CBS 8840 / NBRC 1802 / NCYC 2889) TaxID=226230 RepID=J5RPK5_SACK1|nr:SLD5-like protein [Saccharomyces kudriavzevii IFO 1802]
MDINIDDILAELDKETTAVDSTNITQVSSSTTHRDANTIVNSSLDLNAKTQIYVSPQQDFASLMKSWRNERCSPRITSISSPADEKTVKSNIDAIAID